MDCHNHFQGMRLGRAWRGFCFSKRLLFGEECQAAIVATAAEVGRVAAVTLGPKGRSVLIEDHKDQPRITKDGVTVVKHLEYEDRLSDAVCTLIKRSVAATNRFAGDGTTTSTILIAELLREGRKMEQCGASVRELKMGLQVGRDIGVQFIRTVSRVVREEQWMQVALVATKGDRELSKLITDAIAKAALIKVERGSLPHSYVEFYGGMKISAGIAHPEFKNVGDRLELDYPLVAVSSAPVEKVEQVVGVLELAKRARKQLLLVSTAISDSVLSTLLYNLRKDIVQAYPLVLRDYGSQSQEQLRQLTQTTGATMFDRYGPCPFQEVRFEHLGRAVRVEMDDFETSITGSASQQPTNAVVYAGGATEAIALEVQDKLVDALNSLQTAKKHGVIAGGGVTYWRLAQLLDSYDGPNSAGVSLLARALRAPRRLLEEGEEGGLRGEGWEGLNFRSGKAEDMFECGVVDSAMVGESVLVDSVSLAQLLLDVQVTIMRLHGNTSTKEDTRLIEDSYRL